MSKTDNMKLCFGLPMRIKHFEMLYEMVGVRDNIESLLDRKSFK